MLDIWCGGILVGFDDDIFGLCPPNLASLWGFILGFKKHWGKGGWHFLGNFVAE